jgi:two-component system response regulator VicR
VNGKQMLAIEHDWRLRKLIRANLEAVGVEVLEAVSGPHSLRLLHENRPDLILLDLDLPGTDVMALLRALCAQLGDRPVPIIGICTEPPSREVLQTGCIASYVRKPFAVPVLLAQIQRALSRPRGN